MLIGWNVGRVGVQRDGSVVQMKQTPQTTPVAHTWWTSEQSHWEHTNACLLHWQCSLLFISAAADTTRRNTFSRENCSTYSAVSLAAINVSTVRKHLNCQQNYTLSAKFCSVNKIACWQQLFNAVSKTAYCQQKFTLAPQLHVVSKSVTISKSARTKNYILSAKPHLAQTECFCADGFDGSTICKLTHAIQLYHAPRTERRSHSCGCGCGCGNMYACVCMSTFVKTTDMDEHKRTETPAHITECIQQRMHTCMPKHLHPWTNEIMRNCMHSGQMRSYIMYAFVDN